METKRLPEAFIEVAKRNFAAPCVTDTTGRSLTYGRTLTAGLLLADWLDRDRPGEEQVGIMLPTTVAGALANLGVAIADRVSVNLNYTAGPAAIEHMIRLCELRTILTARAFLDRLGTAPRREHVFIEDVLGRFGRGKKLLALLRSKLKAAGALAAPRRGAARSPHDPVTIIFSSGSTGLPKGVMLSHANILANVRSLAQVLPLDRSHCLMGVLPIFHSFGYAGTLWFPLLQGARVAYHPDPRETHAVGKAIETHRATMLMATPTFAALYTKKCSRETFASLRTVLVGAEKLRPHVAAAFREKFGVSLQEGYGCTEMSPAVAVNSPTTGWKDGTVGRAMPGVSARVVDPETAEPLGAGREGLLLVNGPNRMLGYFRQPEETTRCLRDGWYVTGDIAMMDHEGFITITDRLARFSKIGGEMVPHGRVEEAIQSHLGGAACVVVGIPDDARGERLVVLHTAPELDAGTVGAALAEAGMPRLMIPRPSDFHRVEAIPVLGTGKLDLCRARALAVSLTAAGSRT